MGLFGDAFNKLGEFLETPANNEQLDIKIKEFYEKVVKLEKEKNVQKLLDKPIFIEGKQLEYSEWSTPIIVDYKIYRNIKRNIDKLLIGELEEVEQHQRNIALATRFSYNLDSTMSLTEFEKQGFLNNISLIYEPSSNNPKLTVAVYSDSFKIGYINKKEVKKAEWLLEKQKQFENSCQTTNRVQLLEYDGIKEPLIETSFYYVTEEHVTSLTHDLKKGFDTLVQWYSQLNKDLSHKEIVEELCNIEEAAKKNRGSIYSGNIDDYIKNELLKR